MLRCFLIAMFAFGAPGTAAAPGQGKSETNLDRVRMEAFISMAEGRIADSVRGRNMASYLGFFRTHIDDDARIWVRREIITGYQGAAHTLMTMNKNQFIRLAGVVAWPFLTGGGDYSIDIKLTHFSAPRAAENARASIEIDERMSVGIPVSGGAETVDVEVTTICNQDVRFAENGEEIILGDMFCKSEMRL
ncbi:MAG: hypothetical protein EOM26_09225 [Alphaproteobacteria bacterium]|nr:hypothetical protein [Alphaproteobacteria bacterium]